MKPNLVRASLLDMQICVPKEYTDEQVIEAAELLNPSGTKNGWQIRKQGHEDLRGDDERVTCAKWDENVHVTLDA